MLVMYTRLHARLTRHMALSGDSLNAPGPQGNIFAGITLCYLP
jgi:hypothetical protein